ncbi:hypothetical protein PpBr36_02711 [Pyricularia pennisetigena]|uniref:hypothetical protein n=1 Tax=Pyricularia pennisetigena TaxID=1578925 RepID=UPI00114D942D|nr:hypothetical protein PpBr36_02711 [Pyricularia pennisetigena]TLS30549.1 hypothetical protein PpBr36_02711 [Pyricularia pennisetigena]
MTDADSTVSLEAGQQQSPELRRLSVRCALAKKEWDELIRTGRKTMTTRRELSTKWNVEYSVLCRTLRRNDHRRIRSRRSDHASDVSTSLLAAKPPMLPSSSPGPEVLPYLPGALKEVIQAPPASKAALPQPTATPVSQLCELLDARLDTPIPATSAMRRVNERHLESEKGGWTAVSGDQASLLSDSEEEVIRKWFRFRLDVADLVTVYEMVDAANSAILISTKGVPLDEEGGQPCIPLQTVRFATTRWARDFMLLRPDLFWSTVKPRLFDLKERPVPDTHCFIEWFYGASGPEDKEIEPKPVPPMPDDADTSADIAPE